MDDEILRIFITTDNHLGFMEKDPVRGDDSFAVFEECLCQAKVKKTDFMLMAGDMFHENRPSRYTMFSTIELLRKYCVGHDPVYFEILNEQSEIFKSVTKSVNYEDSAHSISLPIFSIHGNHDDPTRESGRFDDSLATLDLLSASNLLNYFGKSNHIDEIEVTPLLIRKGDIHVALYGLGAVRDERLNRLWNQKNVKFNRPSTEQGKDSYFNIFVIHQNRDSGRGTKNCVHESMIPEWMDLVIWGNEHECVPKAVESLVGTFRIYQPGSSIATSFCEGESMSNPKHYGILEIKKTKEYRMTPFPYIQQRPFIYKEVSLSNPEFHLDPNDTKIEEKIKKVLHQEISAMIQTARVESARIEDVITNTLMDENDQPLRKFLIKNPKQVLVRLRVEHNGYNTINTQRFGSQFVNHVANPSEILLFAKLKVRNIDNVRAVEGGNRKSKDSIQQIIQEGDNDQINQIKIEDLVMNTLQESNKKLSILPEIEMSKALDDFVVKRFIHAISGTIEEAVKLMKSELIDEPTLSPETLGNTVPNKTAIAEAAAKIKKKTEEESRRGTRVFVLKNTSRDDDNDNAFDAADSGDNSDHAAASSRGRGSSSTARGGSTAGRGRGVGSRGGRGGRGSTASTAAAAVTTASRGRKASTTTATRGRGRGRGAALRNDIHNRDDDDDIEDDSVDDDSHDDIVEVYNPKPSTSRGNGSSSSTTTSSSAKTKPSHQQSLDSDDEEVEIVEKPTSSSANSKPMASSRNTAQSSKKRPLETDVDDRNDDVDDILDSDVETRARESKLRKKLNNNSSSSSSSSSNTKGRNEFKSSSAAANVSPPTISAAFGMISKPPTAPSSSSSSSSSATKWQSSQRPTRQDSYDENFTNTATSPQSKSTTGAAAGVASSQFKLPSYLNKSSKTSKASANRSIDSGAGMDDESTDKKAAMLSGWD